MFYRYGNFTMAYATLQPGLKYFEGLGGYLAYDTSLGITFVLGDPVAPPENYPALIKAFVEKYPMSCFCQVSRPVAEVLSGLGRYVNEFGADIELELTDYNFDGPKKSKLRQAAHKVEREGYTIVERLSDEIDRYSLESLSAAWRATKRVKHEARFLVRPMTYEDEPDVRKFYLLDPAGEVASFVAFDPICVPFYQIEESGFAESVLLKKACQWLYRNGDRWVYSFRGHADFKHRYRGTPSKVYFASYTRWRNAFNLAALMRVCRFI
jgi:lysylphosphatidylglycerol synthetase-like protein (DUF2156 family)